MIKFMYSDKIEIHCISLDYYLTRLITYYRRVKK